MTNERIEIKVYAVTVSLDSEPTQENEPAMALDATPAETVQGTA